MWCIAISEPFISFISYFLLILDAIQFWCTVVQEAVSDGEDISYPISEVAGQTYAYRISQDVVVLGTRGLTLERGVDVGLKEIASGLYKCVSVNKEANNSQTVIIHVDGGFDMDVAHCMKRTYTYILSLSLLQSQALMST